ncbi:MAG TPA: glycosyltransferase [Anditalea sp.]|nr:glycosyltransferase [Anditalea sp.]
MKLSIIVPVYNISSFIQPCLESIVKINLRPDEYEVIVINDGSTDDSLDKINEVALQHTQIKIISQENMGLGGARNTGIAHATGEYIWFVDGDDLVIGENVTSALKLTEESGVEVLAFDFYPVNEKGQLENWIHFKLISRVSKQSGPEFYLMNYAKSYIWLYFFKRKIFTENKILFHESIKMEDSEIMPKIMAKCETVCFYDQPLICYRKREGSITNIREEKARNHFYFSMVKVAESLRDFQSHFSVNSIMYEGIELKRKQINQMLFTNLIHNDFSNEANEYYVELLQTHNILPFSSIQGFSLRMNFKFNLARRLINFYPLKGRFLYRKIFNN